MTRLIILGAAMLACLPAVALGQTRSVPAASVPCCGQQAAPIETLAQIRLETQQNLQGILMLSMNTKRLLPGDYYISESAEGYEFRALVSRKGVVDSWYVADLDGVPIALISVGGGGTVGGTGGGISDCFTVYSRDVSQCAYLQRWPNRHQLCLDNAWDKLIGCLSHLGGSGGVVIR